MKRVFRYRLTPFVFLTKFWLLENLIAKLRDKNSLNILG